MNNYDKYTNESKSSKNNNPLPHSKLPAVELPFLVTHWLSNYGSSYPCGSREGSDKRVNNNNDSIVRGDTKPLTRIHRAAMELASAFQDLGAYGMTMSDPIAEHQSIRLRNTSFFDMKQQWSSVPHTQLENLAKSSQSTTEAVRRSVNSNILPNSIIDAAYERTGERTASTKKKKEGECTLVEAIDEGRNEDGWDSQYQHDMEQSGHSMLHQPTLLSFPSSAAATACIVPATTQQPTLKSSSTITEQQSQATRDGLLTLEIKSDHRRLGIVASQSYRRYLTLREKNVSEKRFVRNLQRSISLQQKAVDDANRKVDAILATKTASVSYNKDKAEAEEALAETDQWLAKKMNAERVLAQLHRKLEEIANRETEKDFQMSKSVAEAVRQEVQMTTRASLPCYNHKKNKPVISHILRRQYGGVCSLNSRSDSSRLYGAVIESKMSHSVTINCHLFFPVYCLRFDRSGRYFVTGADDQLVKIFRLGGSFSESRRGAVLVCTLRGHAAVITDIDVSSDNSLLATASEDGDVRIWGMRDGCPIAILRGHEGGANMVSWSIMTPFRIVTTGEDGLARMWDIREAALKRCSTISCRTDYTLSILGKQKVCGVMSRNDNGNLDSVCDGKVEGNEVKRRTVATEDHVSVQNQIIGDGNGNALLPALRNDNVDSMARTLTHAEGDVLPPRPPLVINGMNNTNGVPVVVGRTGRTEHDQNQRSRGSFVAGSEVDEGVQLLANLQHNNTESDNNLQQGRGTRSSTKTVKVVCLSRSPVSGHFATGSDDGVGRIWIDEDDEELERTDGVLREYNSCFHEKSSLTKIFPKRKTRLRNGNGSDMAPSTSRLLAKLEGHQNGITDIEYSHVGDRILTASQKDGIIRVWSWGSDISRNTKGEVGLSGLRQIVIRLTVPSQCATSSTTRSSSIRRRPRGGGGNSTISPSLSRQVFCDLAVWTSDDSKIITSQSSLLKATGNDIVPGSHVLYVWDSYNGLCLIGFPSAHNSCCQVLVSHPLDSSILASAGLDGHLKVWNLESGKCIFSHCNVLQFGAVEIINDYGKKCGYLDGNFSPDGLVLVLTDDMGRVTLLDVFQSKEDAESSSYLLCNAFEGRSGLSSSRPSSLGENLSTTVPKWMKEQYFANDYYDLFYDSNAYCIEVGSQQPPHLAPVGARCDHSGVPYPEPIQESFRRVRGPIPILERDVRLGRDFVRSKSFEVRRVGGILAQNVHRKPQVLHGHGIVGSLVGNNATTIRPLQNCSVGVARRGRLNQSPSRTGRTMRPSTHLFSSNYRWSGYEDMMREDAGREEAGDTDDEEYHEGPASPQSDIELVETIVDDDVIITDDEEFVVRSPPRRRRRRMNRANNIGSPSSSTQRGSDRRRRQNSSARSRRNSRSNHTYEERMNEMIRNEPTRVSSRQQGGVERRHYEDNGSSDDSIVDELLSANTRPFGEHLEDYTKLGHIFKLSSGDTVNRKWVSRDESILGSCGTKVYAPQVGDSVVYIARAHYDTLEAYPTVGSTSIETPWKSWPTSSPWPVVRCRVKSLRYRFPVKQYYSRSSSRILSVMTILTLEITGVPVLTTDRPFPWPKPEFIALPGSQSDPVTFDVSVFISEEVDFVIPEQLYTWRLSKLEDALLRKGDKGEGFDAVQYFINPKDSRDDPTFEPHSTFVTGYHHVEETEYHFQCSGYNALHVLYGKGEQGIEEISAWEVDVTVDLNEKPLPPCLTTRQKETLSRILDNILKEGYYSQLFSIPVDTTCYVDYLQMIEVPMDVAQIHSRLTSDFYTSIYSVAADVKLISENCLKYNRPLSDVWKAGNEFYEKFQSLFEEEIDVVGIELCSRSGTYVETRKVHGNENLLHASSSSPGRLRDVSLPDASEYAGTRRVQMSRVSNNSESINIDSPRRSSRLSKGLRTRNANTSLSHGSFRRQYSGHSTNRQSLRSTVDSHEVERNDVDWRVQELASDDSEEYFDSDKRKTCRKETRTQNLKGGKPQDYVESDNDKSSSELSSETVENTGTNDSEKVSAKTSSIKGRASRAALHSCDNLATLDTSTTHPVSGIIRQSQGPSQPKDKGFREKEAKKGQEFKARKMTRRQLKLSQTKISSLRLKLASKKEDTLSVELSGDNGIDTDSSQEKEKNPSKQKKINSQPKRSLRLRLSVRKVDDNDGNSDSSPNSFRPKRQTPQQNYGIARTARMSRGVRSKEAYNSEAKNDSTSEIEVKADSYRRSKVSQAKSHIQRQSNRISSRTRQTRATTPCKKALADDVNGSTGDEISVSSLSGRSEAIQQSSLSSPRRKQPPIEVKTDSYRRPVVSQGKSHIQRQSNRISPRTRQTRATTPCKKARVDNVNGSTGDEISVSSLSGRSEIIKQSSLSSPRRKQPPRQIKQRSSVVMLNEGGTHAADKKESSRHKKSAQRRHERMVNYCDASDSDFSDLSEGHTDFSDANESVPEQKQSRRKQNRGQLDKSSSLEEVLNNDKLFRNRRKRFLTTSKGNNSAKRQKVQKSKECWRLPTIPEWPRNIVKEKYEIHELALRILEKVHKLDVDKVFHYPVLDLHPDISNEYLSIVSEPMDFQTIKSTRINTYRVISDLQQDLIKVFQNCCEYNRQGSAIWKYAVNLWMQLNDVFSEVLQEKEITLPRRANWNITA